MATPSSSRTTSFMSLSRHTLSQLKFVLPGAAITYYLGTHEVFWNLLSEVGRNGWARYITKSSWPKFFIPLIGRTQTGSHHLARARAGHRWLVPLCTARSMATRHRAQRESISPQFCHPSPLSLPRMELHETPRR